MRENEAKMNKWSKFWTIAGPLIAIPAAFYFTVQLASMFGKSEYEIEVTATEESFSYPDSVQIAISGYFNSIAKSPFDSAWDDKIAEDAIGSMSFFSRFEEVLIVRCKNVGSKECTNLKLSLDTPGYCRITKPGSTISKRFNDVIDLGSLQPSEQVDLIVWCTIWSSFDKDDTKLSFTEGQSDVDFSIQVWGIKAFLVDFWWAVLLMLGWLVWVIVPIYSFLKRKRQNPKLPDTTLIDSPQ